MAARISKTLHRGFLLLTLLSISLSSHPVVANILAHGATIRVSTTAGGVQGNDHSVGPSLSADGRYIAFLSYATNLVENDTNNITDIFVKDRQTGEVKLVSVSSIGTQANDYSQMFKISSSGRYVVFQSAATNLVEGDTNGVPDIFVHDLQTGQTERISVSSGDIQANGRSNSPVISSDERYVVYSSNATNLVPGDTNALEDVFLYDRQTRQTERISLLSDGSQLAGYGAGGAALSGNSRLIVFESGATNLAGEQTWGASRVYLRNLDTDTTTLISKVMPGAPSTHSTGYTAVISEDGRYIFYVSGSSYLVPNDTNYQSDIFIYDRQLDQTQRLSMGFDGSQTNDDSGQVTISYDGRYVAFYSGASNLVSNDTNGTFDGFVYDRQSGETVRATISTSGAQANDASGSITISPNGRYIGFNSYATNLVAGDTNGTLDVFIHDREDANPPPAVSDLAAVPGTSTGKIDLSWTSPADDGLTGKAAAYEVRYAQNAITTLLGWEMATQAEGEPEPGAAGTAQSMTITGLEPGKTYHFALRAQDVAGNWSDLSNSPGAQARANIIEVSISLYKTATADERTAYQNILGYFADAIFEMTNGAHQVGKITLYQNSQSAGEAQVLWQNSAWPCSNVAGYSHPNQHVWMADSFSFPTPYQALAPASQRGAGYTLAHEWGHYYYGLYDEYRDPKTNSSDDPGRPLAGDSPVENSIMNNQFRAVGNDYNWLNFSVDLNTLNGQAKTAQDRVYAASGWETLARPTNQDPRPGVLAALPARVHFPDLASVAPQTGQPAPLELGDNPPPEPRSQLSFQWVEPAPGMAPQTGFTAALDILPKRTIQYPQPVLLVASVVNLHPVTRLLVSTYVLGPNGENFLLSLKDDGNAPDVRAEDGLYTGILPYTQNGVYSFSSNLIGMADNAVYTQGAAAHTLSPNDDTFTPALPLVGEAINAWASGSVTISGFLADDHGDTPATATSVAADNQDHPGRIDHANDRDMFVVTPGTSGRLAIRLGGFGQAMSARIRIFSDDGASLLQEFTWPGTNPSAFSALMQVAAGSPIHVEISHLDGAAAQGYYTLSTGSPTPAEIAANQRLFLPVIVR